MMINITPNSLLKIFSATKIPLSGNMAIKKIPKNRYFTNARLHSFCFFTVATMASFMFKFCLFWDFMFRANFSEIYAVKARVWASKRLN